MSEELSPMMLSREERALISQRRLEQAPELPAEPYTVIKVSWRDERTTNPVLMRFPEEWYNEWGWSDGDDFGTADALRRDITGYEVLARPHVQGVPTDTRMSHETFAETYPNEVQFHYDGGYLAGAKAVLERWAELHAADGEEARQQIQHELGLES